VLETLIIFIRE